MFIQCVLACVGTLCCYCSHALAHASCMSASLSHFNHTDLVTLITSPNNESQIRIDISLQCKPHWSLICWALSYLKRGQSCSLRCCSLHDVWLCRHAVWGGDWHASSQFGGDTSSRSAGCSAPAVWHAATASSWTDYWAQESICFPTFDICTYRLLPYLWHVDMSFDWLASDQINVWINIGDHNHWCTFIKHIRVCMSM